VAASAGGLNCSTPLDALEISAVLALLVAEEILIRRNAPLNENVELPAFFNKGLSIKSSINFSFGAVEVAADECASSWLLNGSVSEGAES
jgi:hypothetical protein